MPESFVENDGFIIKDEDLARCDHCPTESVVMVNRTQVMLVSREQNGPNRYLDTVDREDIRNRFAACSGVKGLLNKVCGVE